MASSRVDHITTLKKRVKTILEGCPLNSCRIHSFWNHYKDRYKELPKVFHFVGAKSRSDLLYIYCKDFCHICKRNDGFDYITLSAIQQKRTCPEDQLKDKKPLLNEVKPGKSCSAEVKGNVKETLVNKQKPGKSRSTEVKDNVKKPLVNEFKPEKSCSAKEVKDNIKKSLVNEEKIKNKDRDSCEDLNRSVSMDYRDYRARLDGSMQHYVASQGNNQWQVANQALQQQPYYRGYVQTTGTPQPVKQNPSTDLEAVTKSILNRIADADDYVSLVWVEKLLLEHYRVKSLNQIGVSNITKIKPVYDHQRLQCKINAYIEAYVRVHSICTLHELEQKLSDFCCPGQQFKTLRVGPLQKIPKIYDLFKFPPDVEIPEITTGAILDLIRSYLTSENLWKERIEVDKFMEFLMKQYSTDSPYSLGVRISSFPLAVQVLKRAQGACGETFRESNRLLNDAVVSDIAVAYRNFSSSILIKEPGFCLFRREYLTMSPEEAVIDVFSKVTTLLESLNFINKARGILTQQKMRELNKTHNAFLQFNQRMKLDSLYMKLFQFCLCTPREDIHRGLDVLLNCSVTLTTDDSDGTNKNNQTQIKAPALLYEVVDSCLKYMERCFNHGGLSLTNLIRIEEKLLSDFEYPNFAAMGHGNFLEFLNGNSKIKQCISESGGGVLGEETSSRAALRKEIINFIATCDCPEQKDTIEAALCHHFKVKEVKDLGWGNLSNLMTVQTRQSQHERAVIAETALCATNRGRCYPAPEGVGLLGSFSKEQALAVLQNCPLLENMADWSQWSLFFQPQLGDLRDFLLKHGGLHTHQTSMNGSKGMFKTTILGLETQPGVFLRITCNTSPEDFQKAAMSGDVVNTCGHLVSIVVKNNGFALSPLVLLGNNMRQALLHFHSMNVTSGTSDDKVVSKELTFVLECLEKLPLVFCQVVANKVFLEPLSSVIGSAKSKERLLAACASHSQSSRLHILGALLGVIEWSNDFYTRTKTPAQCLIMDESIPKPKENEGDDVSSSEEMEDSDADSKDDSYNDVDFLSDDGDDVINDNDSDGSADKNQPANDKLVGNKLNEEKCSMSGNVGEKTPSDLTPEMEVVYRIRREEFGIGVELPEVGNKLVQKHQDREGRSLEKLSKEINSKDTHFVLELIQNADDNTYPEKLLSRESNRVPAVKFIIDEKCITVLNNEVGFTAKNIGAICDVGKSTKGKHKFGYIGQKGIGFKSVFRITNEPQIHSNGYHIKFDVNSGPSGYILPHWIEEEKHLGKDSKKWTTHIVLPIKEEFKEAHKTSALAARFQDVHPSLLLFLHRLKSIFVHNKVDNYIQRMQRRDLCNNLVEIKHSNGIDKWFVIKKIVDASHLSLQAKSGVDVESTEIALAFPFAIKGKREGCKLEAQPVFAFLPLRSYNFKFVIQADFDLPVSREDVDSDSLWNQWLRAEIHSLFVEAFEKFKTHPNFETPIKAVLSFLSFIPLQEQIPDFFRPVASDILQKLISIPCLPSQPSNGHVEWKLPSQLVIVTDKLVLDFIADKDLQNHLGLHCLHNDVAQKIDQRLAQALGIQQLTTEHLLEIGKGLVQTLEHTDNEQELHEHVLAIAKWMTCVFRSLDDLGLEEGMKNKLLELSMLPLVDGTFIKPMQQTAFFPLEFEKRHKLMQKATHDPLLFLEKDINTIHPKLTSCQDDVSNSQVCHLLSYLGIKHLQSKEIIHHHILPVLKDNEKCKMKEHGVLIAYIVFIKEALDKDESLLNMDELRNTAVIFTNKGMARPNIMPVHFSVSYGNKLDLCSKLPGYNWTILDDCYLRNPGVQGSWRQFFIKLGVKDFLAVKKKLETFKGCDIVNTVWSDYKCLLPDPDAEYQILDIECQQFKKLVNKNKEPQQLFMQMTILFQELCKVWDNDYQYFSLAELQDCNGKRIRDVPSSFGLTLQNAAWLPTRESTTVFQGTEISEKATLKQGRHLFLKVPQVTDLLRDKVCYLETPMDGHCNFLDFLQIKRSITVNFIKDTLISWSQRHQDAADEMETNETNKAHAVEFSTSADQINRVYQYLKDNLSHAQLEELFQKNPVIFVPHTSMTATSSNVVLQGLFFNREEVRWSNKIHLFDKYRSTLDAYGHSLLCKPTLDTWYKNLREFFLTVVGVDREPKMDEYLKLVTHITSTTTLLEGKKDVISIFSVLGEQVAAAEENDRIPHNELFLNSVKSLRNSLKSPIIPVSCGRWASFSEKPMFVGNNQRLAKLFAHREKDGILFVDLGKSFIRQGHVRQTEEENAHKFLRMCGLGSLENLIEVSTVTQSYRPNPRLQTYVHKVMPFLQQLLHQEYPDVYEEHKDRSLPQRLSSMQFGVVGKLEVVYSLKEFVSQVAKESKACHLNDNLEFSVHMNYSDNMKEINREMAHFFALGRAKVTRDIERFLDDLEALLAVADDPKMKKLMERYDLNHLPAEEEKWEVSLPPANMYPPEIDEPHQDSDSNPLEPVIFFKEVVNPVAPPSDGKMKSWPPRSSNMGPFPSSSEQGAPKMKSMWPPPAFDGKSGYRRQDDADLPREGRKEHSSEQSVSRSFSTPKNPEHVDSLSVTPSQLENRDQGDRSSNQVKKTDSGKRTREPSFGEEHLISKRIHTDDPIWSADVEKIEFEELVPDAGMMPDLQKLLDDSKTDERIGMWGEEFVYQFLKQEQAQDPNIINVTWLNEDTVQDYPYDILVKYHDDASETLNLIYVEVKTTALENKHIFPISSQQIRFAQEKQERYQIYRVFNAGQGAKAKLVRLTNPAEKMDKKQIKLFMQM